MRDQVLAQGLISYAASSDELFQALLTANGKERFLQRGGRRQGSLRVVDAAVSERSDAGLVSSPDDHATSRVIPDRGVIVAW